MACLAKYNPSDVPMIFTYYIMNDHMKKRAAAADVQYLSKRTTHENLAMLAVVNVVLPSN